MLVILGAEFSGRPLPEPFYKVWQTI